MVSALTTDLRSSSSYQGYVSACAYLLDQLSAGVLNGVLKLNCTGDGDTIVDDLGYTVWRLQHHVAPWIQAQASALIRGKGQCWAWRVGILHWVVADLGYFYCWSGRAVKPFVW